MALDEAANILGSAVMNIGTGTNGVELALAELERTSNLRRKDILYTVVTGYGRMTYKDADEQITEISCHTKGVVACHPEACSIIDIGGQDPAQS